MQIMKWIVTYGCKLGLEVLCKIDAKDLKKVQSKGPLILFTNHTGMVEAPLMYTQLQPRENVTALAKVETWDNWFLNWVFTLWNIIPIHRGEADMVAMRKALDVLERGSILGISPEGTRSREGKLIRAHGGVAMLALHSAAPIQPVAHWGGEHFGNNVKQFKRTSFTIRVGPVFHLDSNGQRVTKEIRQQMADEMMYQLAKLLPEENRGQYADLENATEKYLRFVDAG
ncbi:MAG: lysophospholipid acyltransferase family protein [Chloroflexota bacterium]